VPPRRFPAPWRAERISHGYVVRDDNGRPWFLVIHLTDLVVAQRQYRGG